MRGFAAWSRCFVRRGRHGRPRARAARSRSAPGRVLRGGRAVGLRQVDLARADRGARGRDQGTVTFEGRPIAGAVPDGIGVVFQEDASFPWLTVERQHRVRPAHDAGFRRGAARAGRARPADHGARRFRPELSGAAVRRHAPARLHRPHPRHAAAADPARRAVRCARSADAALDGRRGAAAVAGDRAPRSSSSRMRSTRRRCSPTASA